MLTDSSVTGNHWGRPESYHHSSTETSVDQGDKTLGDLGRVSDTIDDLQQTQSVEER